MSIELADVENIAHLARLHLSEDVVAETDHRDELQEIAPETEDGLFLVPKVIE
jgi:aspartyl-tRNA(Asn)/glutamyl-tRNA(Gln) amidotransferase subunit C